VIIAYSVDRVYYILTDDFTIDNISSKFLLNPTTQDPVKQESLSKALEQEYHYLGKGGQSFVFLSNDQNYVIKFFKFKHLKPRELSKYLPLPPILKEIEAKSLMRRQKRQRQLFDGFQIAFNELSVETGIVYIQLAKTFIGHKKLTLYDKLGLLHQIDLNQMVFVLQKRAQLFCAEIDKMMHSGKKEGAVKLIKNLVEILILRCHKGIKDADHAFILENLGVIDGKVVFLDPGRFCHDKIVKDLENCHEEIAFTTHKLQQWLAIHHPELITELQIILETAAYF